MDSDTVSWTRVAKSGVAVYVPCKVWGFLVRTGSGKEEVVIYDGQDTGSGMLFSKLYCALDGMTPFLFTKPLAFTNGVYLDFTGNIDEVTVLWEPAD